MKPKFSICIFTYNRAQYIKDSIKSALNQVYNNYEIIIVDDGSTDNTEEIIRSFDSTKIKYTKKEHSGAPKTRNRAISESNGEYLVWLADDDILLPSALQYYSIYLDENPQIDVLYSYIKMFNLDSDETTALKAAEWYNRNEEALAFLVKGSPITDGGCAVRKKIYDEIGGYNEEFKRAQDYEFWARVIQCDKYKLKLVPKYQYLYRLHNSNITGEFSERTDFSYEVKIIESLVNNNSLKSLFPDLQWSENTKEAEFNAYLFLALKYFYINSESIGIQYLAKAKNIRKLSSDEMGRLEEIIKRYSDKKKMEILNIFNDASKDKIFYKYEKAISEIEKENYVLAEENLDEILNKLLKDKTLENVLDKSQLQTLLANISLINQNLEKSKSLFETVLQENPNSSEACQGLGEIFLKINDLEAAKVMFEWAIKNNDQNNTANEYLSVINENLNLPENHNSLLMSEQEL